MEQLKNPQDMTPKELMTAVKLGQLSIETAEILMERSNDEKD